jgi:flagellar biosynthetic protein FliO
MDGASIARLGGALAALAAVLFALRWVLRAAAEGTFVLPRRGRLLRVVDTLALGPGAALHVVDAGGRRLLVGAAAGGVTLLGELPPGDDRALEKAKGIDPPGAKLASDVGREEGRGRSTRSRR